MRQSRRQTKLAFVTVALTTLGLTFFGVFSARRLSQLVARHH
jgi:hypothetical protein